MKIYKLALAFLSATLLYSCLDIGEKIVLNADNSGTYSMTIDGGGVMSRTGAMKNNNAGPQQIKQKKTDTTIYLKNIFDTADSISGAEKALYQDGTIQLKVDDANSEMKIVISAPFKNITDLVQIKNTFLAMLPKLQALQKRADGTKSPGETKDITTLTKYANPFADQFNFMAKPGRISDTILNMDDLKTKLATDPSLKEMAQITGILRDFNYHTTIVLPSSVKKFDGPGSTVSADQKTIGFTTTLTELMEHPEKVSYSIEY